MIATVGDLRKAIQGVHDDMEIILRVSNEDGSDQYMCCPSNATPDAGCGDVEAFIIDGTENECRHERQLRDCQDCQAEAAES